LVPEPGPLREGDVVLVDGRSGELRLLARAGETPEVPPEPPAPPRRSEAGRSAPASDRVVLQGEPAVLRLDEIDGRYTEFVGGKSAKLGEMFHAAREADASVPEGIALTHFAYERFLEESGIKDRVEALARELDSGGDAQGLSKKIREVILSGRLSPEQGVGKRILDSLPPFEDWAVRSSAIQEDTDDAAFAGAAESYLFVKREDVLAKVVENWASFWLPRGIQYRRAHGLGSSELRPATLIQRMVQAEKSGVIFTRNPVTSADEIVINAVYGLGEGAVSGLAEADAYATRKPDGEEVGLAHVARKRRQVSPAGVGPVPKPLRSRRVLTRGQTRGLSKAALSLERHFGKALDVEFSIVDGRIVILQARPITTLD
jgi:pyruvate,water dikinase